MAPTLGTFETRRFIQWIVRCAYATIFLFFFKFYSGLKKIKENARISVRCLLFVNISQWFVFKKVSFAFLRIVKKDTYLKTKNQFAVNLKIEDLDII